MRIRIVLAQQNSGWVIGKMAYRLCDALRQLGCDVDVAAQPDERADINHWMSFAFADGCARSMNTMFVTHADDPFKVNLIRERLRGPIQIALCMSSHAMHELVELGIPASSLWYVLPAIDAPIAPRRIRIGITTRVYDDGRKREAFMSRLARDMRLDYFHFDIFGEGWDAVVRTLEESGASVSFDSGTSDWQGDYQRIREASPNFDYYLYLGMDEGSLGTLDAVSAGVKTIVTAQGFHLALPDGITHPFIEYEQLHAIFRELSAGAELAAARLRQWTWDTYAREHLGVWDVMCRNRGKSIPPSALLAMQIRNLEIHPHSNRLAANGKIASGNWRFYARALAPTRIRGAIARMRWLQPLRKFLAH
jgi:hypothetical protein